MLRRPGRPSREVLGGGVCTTLGQERADEIGTVERGGDSPSQLLAREEDDPLLGLDQDQRCARFEPGTYSHLGGDDQSTPVTYDNGVCPIHRQTAPLAVGLWEIALPRRQLLPGQEHFECASDPEER